MDELVREARATIAVGSKSFAMASRLFTPRLRERAWLLYGWCRHCDDVIDGQILGHGHIEPDADIDTRLAGLREKTLAALAGKTTGEAAFDGLGRVAAEVALPPKYPLQLLDGFAMDARDRVYRNLGDTLDYCYHVAGVVGVMMAIVMGIDPRDHPTLERASDLGIAFQLANIARDICDDDRLGRCYLPAEWLAKADIPPGELMHPSYRLQLARVARCLVDEAERYEESARYGTPALGRRAALAVLAAASIYGDIGRRVRDLGAHAWDARVSTSTTGKLRALAKAGAEASVRALLYTAPPPREGLYSPPL